MWNKMAVQSVTSVSLLDYDRNVYNQMLIMVKFRRAKKLFWKKTLSAVTNVVFCKVKIYDIYHFSLKNSLHGEIVNRFSPSLQLPSRQKYVMILFCKK